MEKEDKYIEIAGKKIELTGTSGKSKLPEIKSKATETGSKEAQSKK